MKLATKTANSVPFARLTTAAQVILAMVVMWYLFSSIGVRLPFINPGYQVEAYVPDADGLNPVDNPAVMVAGVREGTVVGVTYSAARREALVRVNLAGGVKGKLFANASMRIYPRGALNNLVVDIAPGTLSAGPLRGAMILHSAPAPIGYDQVLADLNPNDRAYAQILIGTLAQMLRGRAGPLRNAIDRLPPLASSFNTVSAELARRREKLTELVGQLSSIVSATGQRGAELTDVIDRARQTLVTTGSQQDAIERALAALPSTLDAATSTFDGLRRLAAPLDPALVSLRSLTTKLPGAIESVRGLLPSLGDTIKSFGALSQSGAAPLASLNRTLQTLTPTALSLNSSKVVPLLSRTVSGVTQNETNISNIMRFWPSTFSEQNAISPLTRAAFLTVTPVDPQLLGLSSWSSSSPAMKAMTRAANRLRSIEPGLFQLPSNWSREPLAVTSVAALVARRCQLKQVAACVVLETLLAHPPKLIGAP